MTTLITKRPQLLWAKFLIGVTLVTSLATFPHLVYADENKTTDLYETLEGEFRLSKLQINNLLLVKERAKNYEALQGIMLQESEAGRNKKSNRGCHGPFQILTSTAMSFIKKDDEIRKRYFGNSNPTPKLVASKLKSNVRFSIDVADGLYAGSLERSKNHKRALMAYNQGDRNMMTERNPMRFKYVREVSAHIKNIIRPLNKRLAQLVPPADTIVQLDDQVQKEELI
jgi:hypothetical protein